MRHEYAKALLAYTCEKEILESYNSAVAESRRESKSLSDVIKRLEESDSTHDNIIASDLHIASVIYNLLYHQSLNTLELKTGALSPDLSNFDDQRIPNVICDRDSLKFAREPYWSAFEACWLSVGICPNGVIEYDMGNIDRTLGFHNYHLIDDFKERFELIRKHDIYQSLTPSRPEDYLHWFTQMEFSFPENLANAIRRISGEAPSIPQNDGTPLLPLERKTLLKLIAAMAIRGYRFDPKAARNQATSDIQSDLDHCGLPLDQKTILKWLREASELIEPNDAD